MGKKCILFLEISASTLLGEVVIKNLSTNFLYFSTNNLF